MAKRRKTRRQHKLIAFKAFDDTDQDILDWWEGIEEGERSSTIRELIREHLNGHSGNHRCSQKTVSEPEVVPMMELARVRDDTTWIREALHDMPAYLEQVIQTVAAMQPAMATAGGVISLQPEPALSTQIRTEREANMRKKTW
ncbi:MAG: hypothetical protein GYB65_21145 [Chloroflexi bacterium]|nr:hypothetical protein [Chloroflexota bacterium]